MYKNRADSFLKCNARKMENDWKMVTEEKELFQPTGPRAALHAL